MRRSCHCWFALLWVVLAALAEGGYACAQRFGFETFDQRAGLKNIDATYMLQDRSGLLWIGTMGGVYRYDGYRFEPAIIHNSGDSTMITGLAEDGLGRVWFSTSDSLGYFEGLNGNELPAPEGGFSFDLANRLSPNPKVPDSIYFISHHALYEAEAKPNRPARILPVLSQEQVRSNPELSRIGGMLATSSGRFWLGCGNSICALDGAIIQVYDFKAGVPREPWRDFFLDSRGVLWARSDHHILRFDAQSNHFLDMGKGIPQSLLGNRQPQVREDHQGRILINLANGMARFENGAWSIFRETVDLLPHSVRAMLIDRQGSVWLALDGGGIARWLGYDQFEHYKLLNGISGARTIWNFLRDKKGDLWIATESGLRRIRKGSSRIDTPAGGDGNTLQRSQSLTMTQDGHIWSGSDNGMVVDFDPATGTSRVAAQFGGGVFQVFPAGPKQMWACTMSGLFLLNAQHTTGAHPKPVIQGNVYGGLQDPEGNTWFIAASGLYRLSRSVWTRIRITDYQPAFSAQIARAGDGTFWLSGSSPVLVHIKVEGESARELERFDSPPLSSRTVVLVARDKRGWLWVGGDDGIDVYNGSHWRHLNTDDGLVSNDIDSSAFFEDQDGSIWIGTTGGISHMLHPESIFFQEQPTLHLGEVAIGNTMLVPGKTTKVPWGHHPLTANLSTLDFARANRITFRYRIEGLNEDWQDSPKHDLRYPPLEPGDYRLAIMAVDAPDNLISPVAYVDFVVTPPWWRSVSIRVAEVLFAIFVMLSIWRWSVRRQFARQRHLEDLVRQRTRELEIEKAELLKARAALQIQATHDPLTGLLNHGAILHALNVTMERCVREKASLGIVLADLDHFKQINDTYGHLTGDLVLQEYARRIKAAVRPYDDVGRYGGEEILIVLSGIEAHDAERRLAELHHALCSEGIECKGVLIPVTCSFGFTWLRPDCDNLESIIERADSAMYAAKRNGRNRVEIWENLPASPLPS